MSFSIISVIFLFCLQHIVLTSSVSHRLALNSFRARQMDLNSASDGGRCKSYMLVGARGTGEAQGSGSLAYNSLTENVMSAVPNGGKYEVVYSSSPEYMVSPKQGSVSGMQYVKGIIARCPNTVFVFLGYSKGAMVATQMLADESLPPNKVVAAALFGNPYFTAGAKQNKCAAKTGRGIASMMMINPPAAYADKIFDCCHQGDMICQTTGSITAHLTYQNDGAPQAAQFIISKLKEGPTSGASGSEDAEAQSETHVSTPNEAGGLMGLLMPGGAGPPGFGGGPLGPWGKGLLMAPDLMGSKFSNP